MYGASHVSWAHGRLQYRGFRHVVIKDGEVHTVSCDTVLNAAIPIDINVTFTHSFQELYETIVSLDEIDIVFIDYEGEEELLRELERRQSDLTTDSCRLQLQAFERSFLSGKGKALRNKIAAGNLLERGENDLADSLCRQSLRYFDFFTRDSMRIAHLYLLSGRIERARGNWLGAVDALLDAKAYGTSMPDDDEFAYRVHERLAFLYRENGLPDRERDCLREALIYARRLG